MSSIHRICIIILRVVAKLNCRIRGLQQPLPYTTGRDQHLLAEFSYSGSLWRAMLLWDATPHLRFSISSWEVHIYDGNRYKLLQGGGYVRYFDVGDEQQFCCAIRWSNEVPTKTEASTMLTVDLLGSSSTSGGARDQVGCSARLHELACNNPTRSS